MKAPDPAVANRVPHMTIALDPKRISITPRDASASLRKGNPSIVLSASEKGLEMNSFMLQPGEDQIIADRLAQLLESHAS